MTILRSEISLNVYRRAGLRVIPIYGGTFKDGSPNPKNPGHVNWQKADWSMTDEQLISDFARTMRWGVVCGSVSGNLYIADYDLDNNFGSVQAAREWRKAHIPELRKLKTWVSFTPSGGIQVYLRLKEGSDSASGSITRALSPLGDVVPESIRSEGQQCLMPPSVIVGTGPRFHAGSYFWLDSETILQGLASIREV